MMRQITCWTVLAVLLAWSAGAQADLLGYWPLDGDGTDLSGNNFHGTVNGGVTPAADRFGNSTGAMSFPGNGQNDNINVGNPDALQMTGAMTVTAWVYLDSTSPMHGLRNSRIFGKMGGSNRRAWSTGIEKTVNGVPYPATMQVASGQNAVVGHSDDKTLPLDQWVHYAGVFTPGESLAVFLNGKLSSVRTDGVPLTQYATNGRAALIGNRPDASDCGWYGFLDEVRIYNEALSASQIERMGSLSSAGDPDPTDYAVRVPVNPLLNWRAPAPEYLADPNGVQYLVYFDPNELLVAAGDALVCYGPLDETSFAPTGDLALMTKYYWRVDVVDANSTGTVIHPGMVWTFTTLPPKAGLIVPADGATDVAKNAVLEWDPGYGAIAHDVYLGTDFDLVAAGDASVFAGRQSEAFLDADLDWQAQYFWRIDEVFASGPPEMGDVWSFTVAVPICESLLAGDVDKDCDVDLADLLLMAANWTACNLSNGDCP